jgi:hypothetical protein
MEGVILSTCFGASERQLEDDVAAAELSAVLGGCKFKTPNAKPNSREKAQRA